MTITNAQLQSMFNLVTITGRLTKDPVVKTIKSKVEGEEDKSLISFDIANSVKVGSRDNVTFYQVAGWGEEMIAMCQQLKKGELIRVGSRSMIQSIYVDEDGVPHIQNSLYALKVVRVIKAPEPTYYEAPVSAKPDEVEEEPKKSNSNKK